MSAQRSQSDTLQDDYVRTGEAVSLDVTPASPMERFAAAVFDATVYMGSAFLLLALTARSWARCPIRPCASSLSSAASCW